jgi:hypothetical protein
LVHGQDTSCSSNDGRLNLVIWHTFSVDSVHVMVTDSKVGFTILEVIIFTKLDSTLGSKFWRGISQHKVLVLRTSCISDTGTIGSESHWSS